MGRGHNNTGRSTRPQYQDSRRQARTGPPRGQPWAFMPLEIMESDAYRSLSINARRVLDRLILEHFHHNRIENGKLRVSARQFQDWGVTKDCLASAIRELEQKRLLTTKLGEAKGVLMPSHIYRLTFYATADNPPTNEWRNWCPTAPHRTPPTRNIIDVPVSRDGQ